MLKMLFFISLLAGFAAVSAQNEEAEAAGLNFGFEWQQRILGLGLEENNGTAAGGGCVKACEWISQVLPEKEFDPETFAYFKEKSFYWSVQQASTSPQCFVQPTTAEDVSVILKLAERAECPFAVKSGGHAAFVGGSNIQDGITIDLSHLNELRLSEDENTAHIGPGNRWIDVYSYLTPKSLMVVGGRVAEIGVGGLVLGGGISFFSSRYGWALDGVRNYEVVVASGEVLNVNYTSHPDLYWALRGGGNNFGIVTRFDLETFPQGNMWGGFQYHAIEHNQTMMDALARFGPNAPSDVDAAAYIAFVWYGEQNSFFSASQLTYAKPVEAPPIFEDFTAIPSVQSTMRITNMTDMALELNQSNPNGMRQSFSSATFLLEREVMQTVFDIFVEEVEAIKEIPGILPAAVFQIMPTSSIARFSHNGGNCLGIEDSEGPLLNLNMAVMWTRAEDDEVVLAVTKRIVDRSVEKAKVLGKAHRYIYQNYAHVTQKVFDGYGEENLERLREISRKYDPEQVFQRLQPGYFKL